MCEGCFSEPGHRPHTMYVASMYIAPDLFASPAKGQIYLHKCQSLSYKAESDSRIPEECPAQIAQLYTACLSEQPERRPKAAELVRVILGTLNGGATAASVLGVETGTRSMLGSQASGPDRLLSSLRRHRR